VDLPNDTRSRILHSAIDIIQAEGERSLRLRSVAAAVGISEPTLYHYFANREALITAAHAERYRLELSTTVDPFLPAVMKCQTREQFIKIVQDVFIQSFKPGRNLIRATRAEIVGASIHREELRAEVSKVMRESLHPTIEALEFAQSRGWLSTDIDPETFAFLNLSLLSGAIFPEVQDDPQLLEKWHSLAIRTITTLLESTTD
jgi:AcrR family transcriptional regulator